MFSFGVRLININVTNSIYFGIALELSSANGPICVSILSSLFTGNAGSALTCKLTTHSDDSNISLLISDTEFINGHGLLRHPFSWIPAVDLSTTSNQNVTNTVTLNNVTFSGNSLFIFIPYP